MIKNLLRIGLLGLILAVVGAGVLSVIYKEDFFIGKAFQKNDLPFSIIITDRNDEELHRSFGNQNREWVNLEEIPEQLKTITLLAEDNRFYKHFGVDPISISRAMITNIKSGRFAQGGSTLTQQIARKAFLYDEKTLQRKAREAAIAIGIESSMTKDEILEMYLNIAPYGPTLAGVKSASEFYFQKPVSELRTSEMLLLAVLPQKPVYLSRETLISEWMGTCEDETNTERCTPFDRSDYQPSRLDNILFDLARAEDWSYAKLEVTWYDMHQTQLPDRKNWVHSDFIHWRFYIQSFLQEHDIKLEDHPGGLVIKTSLDKKLQEEILDDIRSGTGGTLAEKHNIANLAITVLENETRNPLVWIGSKSYWNPGIHGQIDMLQRKRQMGSTMKPFIYSKLIEDGYDPSTTFWDTRVRFEQGGQIIQNYDNRYYGSINMSQALSLSRNVPAAQALYIAGGETKTKEYLDERFDMGINRDNPGHRYGWTLSLGTPSIQLSDIANSYATLATAHSQEICPILNIQTTTGEEIENPCDTTKERVLQEDTKFMIAEILGNTYVRRVNNENEDASLSIKTGTPTNRVNGQLYPTDNLVAGYTPNATIFVWGGNADGSLLTPGSVAANSLGPLWQKTTLLTLKRHPNLHGNYEVPSNVYKQGDTWARATGKTKYTIPGMTFVTQEENARHREQERQLALQ